MAESEIEAARLLERKDPIDRDNIRCRWQGNAETGECRFACFDPVIDLSPLGALRQRVEAKPELAELAEITVPHPPVSGRVPSPVSPPVSEN